MSKWEIVSLSEICSLKQWKPLEEEIPKDLKELEAFYE